MSIFFFDLSLSSPFSSCDSKSSSPESSPSFASSDPSSSETSSASFFWLGSSFMGGGVGLNAENNDFFSKVADFWLSHPDHAEDD